jgi:hypothetical protein
MLELRYSYNPQLGIPVPEVKEKSMLTLNLKVLLNTFTGRRETTNPIGYEY